MRFVNRNFTGISLSLTLLAGSVAIGLPSPGAGAATAQPETGAQQQQLELLRDFIHFIKIARFDVASDLGNRLLDTGITPSSLLIWLSSRVSSSALMRRSPRG